MFWAIALAAAGVASSKKAANTQKKGVRIQQHAVALQNRRARLDAVKQYREARAQILAGAVNSGAGTDSSAAQGIRASLGSQLSENLGFSLEQEQLGADANKQFEKANKYQFIASALSLGSNIAGSLPSGGGVPNTPTTGPAVVTPTTNLSPFIMNRSNINTRGLA